MELSVVAGVVSTVIFVLSMMPMLLKAARTKDLQSYSLGNMVLSNAGNLVHSVYVFSLPPGPIWAMHSFYLVATGTMLFWYVRYTHRRAARSTRVARLKSETERLRSRASSDTFDAWGGVETARPAHRSASRLVAAPVLAPTCASGLARRVSSAGAPVTC